MPFARFSVFTLFDEGIACRRRWTALNTAPPSLLCWVIFGEGDGAAGLQVPCAGRGRIARLLRCVLPRMEPYGAQHTGEAGDLDVDDDELAIVCTSDDVQCMLDDFNARKPLASDAYHL